MTFAEELKQAVRGEVHFDDFTRGIYSTDASHYQVTPACVVTPIDEADAIAAVKIAGGHAVAITARGGGTSLSGQTTWDGMVVDCSKHLNKILEVNVAEGWARVQSGVIRDQLNTAVAADGLHFAPDPATSSRASIGGMIGNNTSGTHSVLYGKTSDVVLECRVVLADGSVLECKPRSPEQWAELEQGYGRVANIHREVRETVESHKEEIQARFPKVMRRVAGYALDAFLHPDLGGPAKPWSLTDLIVGSEGTLGVLLDAKVRLHPLPKSKGVCVVHFHDVIESLAAVDPMLKHSPAAIELLDDAILNEARSNPTTAKLASFFEGSPAAVQIVEFFGDSDEDVRQKIDGMVGDLRQQNIGYAWLSLPDAEGQKQAWEVRRLGLGLIANQRSRRKGIACIEDACVPTSVMAEYIDRVRSICRDKGVELCLYAHASVGVIHARPKLDLHDPADVELMREISYAAFRLVKEYGGAWSGEHGDGLLRGEFIPEFFGSEICDAFRRIKRAFDPGYVMNPGKIVDVPEMTENLRFGEYYQEKAAESVPAKFHYRDQGGFAGAVEQCVGVGACRKLSGGTMCPSYMATRDEEHTTRGRANALRLAMSGQLGADALVSDRMQDVLKLCLSCKACKSECPTSVDVARLKSDVLHMRHQARGTAASSKLLGRAGNTARKFAGKLAKTFNWTQSLSATRIMMEKVAGVDRRRPLPRLTEQTFEQWWTTRPTSKVDSPVGNVVLFIDTFTNCYEPQVGRAAVELLEGCGYVVRPSMSGCCQRPQISQGLLNEAAADGEATLRSLDQQSSDQVILTLEPSCASALSDDLPDLIEDESLGSRVAGRVRMIDEFLAAEVASGRVDATFASPCERIMIHGHCHQKALYGTDGMKQLLDKVEGLSFEEIDSGCCGMAGSFGYQNYDLSEKIGEDRLFPAVRANPDKQIVACGISCRHQLYDFLNVHAKHWVEVITARRNTGDRK